MEVYIVLQFYGSLTLLQCNNLLRYWNQLLMLTADFYKKQLSTKIPVLIIISVFFIIAFVLNITSNQALFNQNLDIVPYWQQNPVLGSHGFIVFMDIISNIFNPLICAAYILIFYLISHRKLQILVFLIWFIFLTFFLSLLKEAIHQARPYWVPGTQVQALQWNCYYEYGCPSGHSMMGLIIMEFILRFFSRVHKCIQKYQWMFFILVAILQILIMLSRVILGMHSFNQVLFGCMIGLFTFVPYYLFIERFLTEMVIIIFKNPRSANVILGIISAICVTILIETLATLLPTYDNTAYTIVIKNNKKCSKHFRPYKSFQYKCFQDSTLIMAAFGILFSLNISSFPHRFAMLLDYTRFSVKYLARFFLTVVCGLIPVAIFMNPLWQKINTSTENLAIIIWACQTIAFFLGTFFLVYIAPIVCDKLGLQTHIIPQNYEDFTQFQSNRIIAELTEGPIIMLGVRETELTKRDKETIKDLQL